MKNIEKYEKEITKHINEYGDSIECVIATIAGIRKEKCYPSDCEECQKKCLEWMYSEYNEPILSDDEKDIIRSMIYYLQKIGCTVNYVIKDVNENCIAYFMIDYENHAFGYREMMASPYFKKDKFNGMEIGKEYTLEELGITCQTQKDNYVRQ